MKDVKDVANPSATGDRIYSTVGYCCRGDLAGYRLDPPRGKQLRCALVLCAKKDKEGFHIHKLVSIEPDQVNQAVACRQKLRRLSKQVRSESTDKRSRALDLDSDGRSACDTKKARTLQAPTTGDSLPDE